MPKSIACNSNIMKRNFYNIVTSSFPDLRRINGLCIYFYTASIFLFFNQLGVNAQPPVEDRVTLNQTAVKGVNYTGNIEKILHQDAQSVSFEENQGQFQREVLYRYSNGQATFQFLKNGVSIGVLESVEESPAPTRDKDGQLRNPTTEAKQQGTRKGAVWNIEFVGGNQDAIIFGRKERDKVKNYIKPGLHLKGVANYGEVWYEGIYENIDARFYGKNNSALVEYDFVVYPDGDYEDIRLRMDGIEGLEITPDGQLVFQTPLGEMKKGRPYCYQVINGQEVEVRSSYVIIGGNNEITFRLEEPFDPNLPLVIDPIILEWSTYLGVSENINMLSVQEGPSGEIFVGGSVSVSSYPTTPGAFQENFAGPYEIFVSKLSADGSTLLASTYIGGSGTEGGGYIRLDNAGNVLLATTSTSTDFPTTPGAFQTTLGGDKDLVAVKLSSDLSTLLYSTYIGGSTGVETFEEILASSTGEMIIVGRSSSDDYPTTSGAFQNVYNGGYSVVVTKVNGTGTALAYSTYIGGNGGATDVKAAINTLDEVLVVGETNGSHPITVDAFDSETERREAFYSRLSTDGSSLIYSTYLGGEWYESDPLISVNNSNQVYIGIYTDSYNYPTTPDAYQTTYNDYGASGSVAITGFDASNNVIYSTYFGTQNTDLIYAMAVTESGEVVFGGETYGNHDFPLVNQITGNQDSGYEGYVAKLNAAGNDLVFSTFYGYSLWALWDRSNSLKMTPNGDVYITGYSIEPLNVTPDGIVTSSAGYTPSYIAKISPTGNLLYGTYFWGSTNTMMVNDAGELIVLGYNSATSTGHEYTTEGAYNTIAGSRNFISKFSSCLPAVNNTISPASQTVCTNGTPDTLIGSASNFILPNLVFEGKIIPYPNDSSLPGFQWQSSPDGVSGWVNVPNGQEKDYQPPSLTTDQYFRRILNIGCDGTGDTSNVVHIQVNLDVAPTIDMGGGTFTICPGGSVTLGGSPTASGGAGGYAYEWSPSFGLSNSAIANPLASPTASAIYTLKVTDGLGCVKKEQAQVTVLRADAGPDKTYCTGSQGVQIGAVPAPYVTGLTFSWQNILGGAAGIDDPSLPQPFVSPTSTTTFVLTVTGPSGCPITDTVTVTVVSAPVADAGSNLSLCEGESVMIGTPSVVNTLYTWTSPYTSWLSSTSTAQPLFSAKTSNADFNPVPLYLIAQSGNCFDMDTLFIQVDSIPIIDLINIKCPSPATLNYSVTPQPGLNYTWSTISPTPPASTMLSDTTAQSPIATVTDLTTFYLSVSNSYGCNANDFVNVSNDCGFACEIPNFTPAETTVCSHLDSVELKPIETYSHYRYYWRTQSGTTEGILTDPDLPVIYVRPTVNTTYVLTAVNLLDTTFQCSASVDVFVEPPPFAEAGPDTSICATTPVQLGGLPVPGFNYSWSPADYLDDPYAANPISTPSSAQRYILTTTFNSNGCKALDTVTVTIRNPYVNAGQDGTFCEGAVVVMGDLEMPNHAYDWSPGIGLSDSTASMPSIVLFSTSTFDVVAIDTVTGCTSRDTIVFTETFPPTADAGPDSYSTCSGGAVVLGTTDSTSFGYSYQWTPTLGLDDPSSPNPVANPPYTTTYTLTVNNGQSFGCNAIDMVTVVVDGTASCPTVDAGSDVTICEGASTSIGTSGSGGTTYSWAPVNGLSDPAVPNPTASPITTTTYYLAATETATGFTALDSVKVTVLSAPIADAGSDVANVCYGSTINIGSSAVDGLVYAWSPSTGLNDPNIAQPILTAVANETYTVTVTNASGCTAEDNMSVTSKAKEADAGSDQSFCTGSVTIGTPGQSGRYYYWYSSNGYLGNTAQISVSPTEPTLYWVRAIYSGCSTYDTVLVTPAAVVDIGFSSPKIVCEGEQVQLGNDAQPGYTYSWSPSTGLTAANIANPIATPTADITYTLTSTNTANGCVRSNAIDLVVNMAEVDAGVDKTVCSGASVQIGTPPVSDYVYTWSPSTGLSNSSNPMPYVKSVTENKTYILTAINTANGCQKSDTMNVFVSSASAPIADAGSDLYFCNNSDGVTIGTPAISGLQYSWSPAVGLNTSNIAQPIVADNALNGEPTEFTLTVYDPTTGCSNTDIVKLNYFEINADVTEVETICLGESVDLDIDYQAFAGSAFNLDISPNEGLTISQYSVTASPLETTDYFITVTHIPSGCTATNKITVNVNQSESPTANAGDDVYLCPGEIAQLGTNSNPSYTYSWKPTSAYYGLSSTSISNPTASPTGSAATYTVTVTDASSGCSSIDKVVVRKVSTPVANAGEDKYLCKGDPSGVQIGTLSVDNDYVFKWEPSLGLSDPNIAQPVASPEQTTQYTLFVTGAGNNSNCTATSTVTVFVDTPPSTELEAFAGQDATILSGESVTLGPINNMPGFTYEWSPQNDLSSPKVANPISSPTITTAYTLVVTDVITGCTSVDQVTIEVLNGSDYGDLPDISVGTATGDYQTLSANNGPSHISSAFLQIGGLTDIEPNGQPGALADVDDNSFTSDENGIASFPPFIPGNSSNVDVSVKNITGSMAYLYGFIDWNNDGDFVDANETATVNVPHSTNGVVNLNFSVPNTAITGTNLGARFRLTTQNALSANGAAPDGEVEDYMVQANSCPISVSLTSDGPFHCNKTTSTLTALPASGVSYVWSSGGTTQSEVVNAPGIYTVTVTETISSCTVVNSISISEIGPPSVVAIQDDLVCENGEIQLDADAFGGTKPYSYSWTGPLSFNSTKKDPNILSASIANGGTYNVVVTDANGCTGTDATQVLIQNRPAPIELCNGESYTLTAPSDVFNVQWYRDGVLVGVGVNYSVTEGGAYTFIGEDADGCDYVSCCPAIFNETTCVEICDNGIDDDGDGLTDCDDPDCQYIELSNINVGPCINHPLQDVATVSVDVSWVNAPANDIIEVSIYGQTEYIPTALLASPQNITFTVPADGSMNNTMTANWQVNNTLCTASATFNVPSACSADAIVCDILYLCGEDKPYDGDAWDHGWLQYLDGLNGASTLTAVLTKPDASGLGMYDPNSPTTPVVVNFSDYDLIIISATTEAHISNDLVNALKDLPQSILNSNYKLINDLGMSASEGFYQFQTHAYIDNTTQKEVYNYNNDNPTYSYVFTKGDYATGASAHLWTNAGEAAAGTDGIYFVFDETDALSGIASTHGKRIYLGYHMNGVYANAENGGVLPAPVENWFDPARHLTLDGKYYFDQALVEATSTCGGAEICNNGVDDDGDGLVDCNDPDCNDIPVGAVSAIYRTIADGNWTDAATWQGGSIPPSPYVNNSTISIEHSVTVVLGDITLDNNTTLWVTNGSLTLNAGNFGINSAVATFTNAALNTTAGFDVDLTGNNPQLYLTNCSVNIGKDFKNSNGTRRLENVCLTVGELYKNSEKDSLINVCATVGTGFENTLFSQIYSKDSEINVVSGNFSNSLLAYLGGSNLKLWVQNGDISNLGFWTADLTHYCVSGTTSLVPSSMLPATEECATIPWYFSNCDCGCTPTPEACAGGIDEDGDGIFDCEDPDCGGAVYAGEDVNSCANENVTLTATATGDTGPYTFAWSHGLGSNASVIVSPSTTTVYSVTISNPAGCTAVDSVAVNIGVCAEICTDGIDNDGDGLIDCNDPDCRLYLAGVPTSPVCQGGNDGSINVTTTGGKIPYSYIWSTGTTSEDLSGLTAGIYQVTVTDTYGCSATASYVVDDGYSLVLSADVSHSNCYGDSNGNINLSVMGGVQPYSYAWSNGATTQDISGLVAGNYGITVSDGNGCTQSDFYTVYHALNSTYDRYYIPIPETNIRSNFKEFTDYINFSISNSVRAIISMVATEDGTLLYYDHWEDGYETDIFNPTQSTTEVWGDGINSNGKPPGFSSDQLNAGDVVGIDNTVSLPRNPSQIYYDGRDKIVVSHQLALSRAAWSPTPGPVLSGAVDVMDVNAFGKSYEVPIGENISSDQMFELTSLFVMAQENNTIVWIDTDGNGTANITKTLQEGETYQMGSGVQAGAKITSSKAVQAHLLTGDLGGRFEARWFTLFPSEKWDNSYFAPVGSTVSSDPTDVFVYNPNTYPITVNFATKSGSGTFSVSSKGVHRFNMPMHSGAHFYTNSENDEFYAISTIDSDASDNDAHDWGYNLVPESYLTVSAVIGWGPGNADLSGNGSPAWVISSQPTTLYVDYDGDPATGPKTDPAGNKYDVDYALTAYESKRIFDNNDNDQTGMYLYTLDGTLISAAWGQDPLTAAPGNPYLDFGTTVPPIRKIFGWKGYELTTDVNGNGQVESGDEITFTLNLQNSGNAPVLGLTIFDNLPSEVTYVPNTTYFNNSLLADNTSGTPFPVDELGYYIASIPINSTYTISFRTQVNTMPPMFDEIINEFSTLVTTPCKTVVSDVVIPVVPAGSNSDNCILSFTDGSGNPVSNYAEGNQVCLQVQDDDVNESATLVDFFAITIFNDNNGDRETINLIETGINTGIFGGCVSSSPSIGTGVEDGILFAQGTQTVSASFTDPKYGETCNDNISFVLTTDTKPLYLTSPGQSLDRVDPVATNDITISSVTLGAVVTDTCSIADGFNTVSYNNNDGTINWTNDWQELGESNGPSTGEVRVASNSLQFGGNGGDDGKSITGRGLWRDVDLSGATTATLNLDFTESYSSGFSTTLAISSNGGSTYTDLETFTFSTGTVSRSYDISAYLAANTRIRFLVNGSLPEEASRTMLFDNVEIDYGCGGSGGNGGSASGAELINNGGFENGTGNLYNSTDNWFNYTGNDTENARNTTSPYAGSYRAAITSVRISAQNTSHSIALNESYTLSLQHAGASNWNLGVDQITAIIYYLNGVTPVSLGTTAITPLQDFGTGYDSFSHTFSAVSDGSAVGKELYIRFESTAGAGIFASIDDVSLKVSTGGANTYPVAVDDNESTAIDATVATADVTTNDTDAESEALSVIDFTQASNGTVVDNGNGTFNYTPNGGYSGTDNFDYLMIDSGSDLWHHWGLNGNGTDGAGNANGAVNGTTTVVGKFGNALSFNESASDYVQMPDFPYSNQFTITFDFKIDDNTGSLFQYIYSHGNINSTNSVNVFLNEASHGTDPNQFRTVIRDTDDGLDNFALQFDASAFIGDGLWHSYTLTVSSSGSTVYIDGVQVASSTLYGGDSFNPAGSLYLAARQDFTSDRFYGGNLDNVQVYGSPLSSSEITDLYNESNRGTVVVDVGGTVTDSVTFTQITPMCTNLEMPAGGVIQVTTHVSEVSGSIPANPNISAVLKHGTTTFVTMNNPVYSSGAGTMTWNQVLGSNYTLPAGEKVNCEFIKNDTGYSFDILYDSQTKPSKIDLPTQTIIKVEELAIYDSAFVDGSIIEGAENGQTVYVRTTVSDPFGPEDITSLDLVITSPTNVVLVNTTLVDSNVVATSGCNKIYEYAWTTGVEQGIYQIDVVAHEGYEGITDEASTTIEIQYDDFGTPCQVQFTDGTNQETTYDPNDQICIQVIDIDENENATAVETVIAVISSGSGDDELLTLTETGINTGVFTACISSTSSVVGSDNNGSLYAPMGDMLMMTYVDKDLSVDECNTSASINSVNPDVDIAIQLIEPVDGVAVVGEDIRFDITVTNTGPTTITSLLLNNTFTAAELNYVGCSLPPDVVMSGSLIWNIAAAIPAGSSFTIEVYFTGLIPANPSVANASVSGNDENTAPVSAGPVSDDVIITNPLVSVDKYLTLPAVGPYLVGDTLTFQIDIVNTGSTAIATLPLSDEFSAACLEFVDAIPAADGSGAGAVVWNNLGQLPVSGNTSVTTRFAIVGNCSPIENLASIALAIDENGDPVPPVDDLESLTVESPPVAVDDTDSTGVATAVTIDVVANDFDFNDNLDTSSVTTVGVLPPGNGSVTAIDPNTGEVTYLPNGGFTGVDSFEYIICDLTALCDTALVTITIINEDCTNGIDDDGDGLIDCDDPDCTNFTGGGLLGGNEEECGAYDPSEILSITLPSGGAGGGYEYYWEYSVNGGLSWLPIPGASDVTYDPPPISQTYWFRRAARRFACAGWVFSNYCVKSVTDCPEICDNGLDDDGDGLIDCEDDECVPTLTASGNISICIADSTTISVSASGGTGPYEYIWDNGLGEGESHIVFPDSTTTYRVMVLTATGCFAVDSVVISVVPCPEDCTDGIDNDGDGLLDCDDPDCLAYGQPRPERDTFYACPITDYHDQVTDNDDNLQFPNFSIYTNPTRGSVTINFKGEFIYDPYNAFCGLDSFIYQVCNQTTGCCDTASVILNIGDSLPPTLVNVPADVTIGCDETVPEIPALVFGVDGCPGIYVSFKEESTQQLGNSCQNYSIYRIWEATDLCGNTTRDTQTITVQDVSAPEIFRVYTLDNGKLIAGGISKRTSDKWKYIEFPLNFTEVPLVFPQVITENESSAVTVRIRNISEEGFEMKLQEEENADGEHAMEEVAWMAIEPGNLTGDFELQSGLLLNVNSGSTNVNFSPAFGGLPAFIATMQTYEEDDPAAIRFSSLSNSSVNLFIQEEGSLDGEIIHADEEVAYLAMDSGTLLDTDGTFVGETGALSMDHNWQTINLSRNYNKPVVILGGVEAGGDPAVIRVKNVTSNSFDVRVQEWDYLNGTHANGKVAYIVIEGNIPAMPEYFCSDDQVEMIPGVNLFAVDNCDKQLAFEYTDSSEYTSGGLHIYRKWTAIDDCGNSTDVTRTDTCGVAGVKLKTYVYGSAFQNNGDVLMRDDLRSLGFLPLEEPYSGFGGFTQYGDGGGEETTQSIMDMTGPDAVVDWVFIEVREGADNTNILATCSGLMQRDGDVVSANGDTIIYFPTLPEGDYYVSIKHRNHLGIISENFEYLSTENPIAVDFRDPDYAVFGQDEAGTQTDNGKRALWVGDVDGDGRVIFQGPGNDLFGIFSHILAHSENTDHLANYISVGYLKEDLNMDGKAIYQGPNNDRNIMLYRTILVHPANTGNLSNFITSQKLP